MGIYKLLALDMDGTLLNEKQEISAGNRKWIHAAVAAGVTVIISTGRGIQSAMPYVEELALKSPIITVNGSEVWKEPHVLLERHSMDPEMIRQLHQISIKYDTWFWAYAVEGMFNKDNWVEELQQNHWLKFGFYTENNENREQIQSILRSWDLLEITNSHPSNIELNPKGISKASGLMGVCNLLGIELAQVVAMGDSMNDISMIRAAGLGVAMGNAQDKVKSAADLITLTNDEDGVADVIRKYILKST